MKSRRLTGWQYDAIVEEMEDMDDQIAHTPEDDDLLLVDEEQEVGIKFVVHPIPFHKTKQPPTYSNMFRNHDRILIFGTKRKWKRLKQSTNLVANSNATWMPKLRNSLKLNVNSKWNLIYYVV